MPNVFQTILNESVIDSIHQASVSGDPVAFSKPMWLAPHHVDDRYFAMLPRGETEISAEEAAKLASIFGKNGELPAERLS